MERLDPRLNAVRADLADLTLEGRVEATRFVKGEVKRLAASVAPVRHAPSNSAAQLTEALFGERVTVFETRPEGWSWVQLAADNYVGWVPTEALAEASAEPTHKVSALRTFVFPEPDIKAPPLFGLPFGATVTAMGEAEDRNARYRLIAPKGAVVTQHLAEISSAESDWTAIAERFLGVPYLWGGKTSLGLDCSGLVQLALRACGIAAPRDSDMQEALGTALAVEPAMAPLQGGDLLFWRGHVCIAYDAETVLHANAHHMAVVKEPLSEMTRRNGPPRAARRIG